MMKFLLLCLFMAYVTADVSKLDQEAKIVDQDLSILPDGSYKWGFDTDNGISGRAFGSLDNPQSEEGSLVVNGESKWKTPEGEFIEIQYTADKDGYRPQGDHLPTPPPIPEAIIKALEYIRAHPPPPEKQ